MCLRVPICVGSNHKNRGWKSRDNLKELMKLNRQKECKSERGIEQREGVRERKESGWFLKS